MNPVEIGDAISDLAQQPFDSAEFPFQFLEAFGKKNTAIDRLRKGNTNQSDNFLAREENFPATIADLYDPETMPENLHRAHEANAGNLERVYIGRCFKNDTERLEKLFEFYTKMIGEGKAS